MALVSTWYTARVDSLHSLRDWTMPGVAPAGGRHGVGHTCSIFYSLVGCQHLLFSPCGAAASWWSSPSILSHFWLGAEFDKAFLTICKTHMSCKTHQSKLINAILLRNGAQSRYTGIPAPRLGMLCCIRKSPFWEYTQCTDCQSMWLLRVKLQETFFWGCREIWSDPDYIRPLAQALEAWRDFMWKTAQYLLFQSKAILAQSRLVMW